jgi:hypothetical protein
VLGLAMTFLATRQPRWVDTRLRWSPRGQALDACGLMAHGPDWWRSPGTYGGAGRAGSTQADRRSTITTDHLYGWKGSMR